MFIEKAGKDLQTSYKKQKKYCLDTKIFLVTDFTSYAKIISRWGFFVFVLVLRERRNSK